MVIAKRGQPAGFLPCNFPTFGDPMKSQSHRTNLRNTNISEAGFTIMQVLITVALIAVVSAFALMAVGSARASMRLTGSTRELAGYLEKARTNAVRRNGTSVITILDANSYSVTMDFDSNGSTETRTIRLQNGVTFASGIGISANFDWRGRITGQIRFELVNDRGMRNSINLSGSGDVTIGSEIFEDSEIGDVTLNSDPSDQVVNMGEPPVSTASPSPAEVPATSPSPSPAPVADASPSPTSSPAASPSTSPSPSGSPTASPSQTASPTSSATPPVCVLAAPSTLTLPKNGSPKTISVVTITNASNTLLTATKSGDISNITPGSTTVTGNGTISYTITYANGENKTGSVTISSACGNKTINISVQ